VHAFAVKPKPERPEAQLRRAVAAAEAVRGFQTEQLENEPERSGTREIGRGDLSQSVIPPIVHEVLSSPGRSLDPEVRAFMEPRFGYDFSQVRVHADAEAAESARAVSALAYTAGQNMVFGESKYEPNTRAGRELLAHELAHTLQQRDAGGASPYADRDDVFEASANEAARNVANGGNVSRSLPVCGHQIQRSPGTDPRWKNSVQAARYRGQIMANRIRKHGILSKDARAKINRELAYFEGDAKEMYIREVLPILRTTVEIEMPEKRFDEEAPSVPSVTGSLVHPDPRSISDEEIYAPVTEAKRKEDEEKKTGPEYAAAREYGTELDKLQKEWEAKPEQTEQERDQAAMMAYYLSTRQSQLEAAGALHARLREQVRNMTPEEIYSEWDSGKEDFVAVASSPAHTLKAKQLHQIWLRYWDDKFKLGESTRIRIARREADADFGEYSTKISRYYSGERNALGPEFAQAKEDEENARAMFRQSVFIMEYLLAADALGRAMTLKQINERALLQDKLDAPIRDAGPFLGAVGAPGSYGIGVTSTTAVEQGETAETTSDVITPSRPVAGFARDIEPKPAPVAVPPGGRVSTQMPPARAVQGNRPTYGAVTPAIDASAETAATKPSPRVAGFRPPPKDIAEKPGLVEVEMGPHEYKKKEYLGDVGAAGEQQARYYVDVELDEHGMMKTDFVLREGGKRSGSLFGKNEFLEAKQHFEQRNGAGSVKGAYGNWGGGDNLDTFNTRYKVATDKGLPPGEAMIEAARKTKTGEWAKAAGFDNVRVTKAEGPAGKFTNVEVEFTKKPSTEQ
jgi:Domain of unknown function (DUF4157)